MSELRRYSRDLQPGSRTAAENVAGETELDAVRVAYLGPQRRGTKVRRTIGALPPQERPAAGKTINDAVDVMESQLLEGRSRRLSNRALSIPSCRSRST